MTNRLWFQLHSWAGFALGGLLFVVCLSGVLATLSYEIQYLADEKFRALEPREQAVPWQQLEQNLQTDYPSSQILGLRVHEQDYLAGEVGLATPEGFRFVYFDPASGQLLGSGEWGTVSRYLRNLHMYLSIGSFGKLLVTSLSWLLLISVVSSFYVYQKWWRQLLKWPGSWHWAPRRDWSGWHKAIGAWSWWFIVLMMVTGLWYFAEHLLHRNDIAHYPTAPTPQTLAQPAQSAEALPLHQLMAKAQAARPELDIRTMYYPFKTGQAIAINGQADDVLVRNRANRVYLDPFTGEVLGRQSAADLDLVARLVDTADPIHFGNFSGLWLKLVYAVFGLGLTILVIGGMRMHWLRTKRKQPSLVRWLGVTGWLACIAAGMGLYYTTANFDQRELGQLPLSPVLETVGFPQPTAE